MMEKEIFIDELKALRKFYKGKVDLLKFIIIGSLLEITYFCDALNSRSIEHWFDRRELMLKKLYGSDVLSELENAHEIFIEECLKICALYKKKKSKLNKLVFKKKLKLNEGDRDKALSYIEGLKESMIVIESHLKRMEKRAAALNESAFKYCG
ncbi:hypothetical protein [Sulfurovum sp.]|uniref:hypothetical protein n=1 Tax=Sulfurovum sp. TaxID=1969726 RepID=UPI0026303998|nr:hypothetical protein [Sulfurovum sp.]